MSAWLAIAIAIAVAAPAEARGERELCGGPYRGRAMDLDLKDADLHDVFRLIADVGSVNIVVPGDVRGRVTLRLRRVPWDQAACTVAAVQRLAITVDGNVLLVQARAR